MEWAFEICDSGGEIPPVVGIAKTVWWIEYSMCSGVLRRLSYEFIPLNGSKSPFPECVHRESRLTLHVALWELNPLRVCSPFREIKEMGVIEKGRRAYSYRSSVCIMGGCHPYKENANYRV